MNMEQFNAYFDDYNLIELVVSKSSGFQAPFSLITPKGVTGTNIIYQYEDHNNHYFGLSFTEPLQIGANYYLGNASANMKCQVKYRFIVKTPRFDEEFNYTGPLGVTYAKEMTIFRLWAPTASKVQLLLNGRVLDLDRRQQGVFVLVLKGDYDKCVYNYLVHVNGAVNEIIDPYGAGLTPNSTGSIILDPKKFKKPASYTLKPLSIADYLIYEMSVYDFSNNRFFKNKGKYLAFQEVTNNDYKDSIGLGYIKSLGVSHIQLQPILDFATKDDYNPHGLYNWGYDPVSFFAMEGSYVSDLKDPYLRVSEAQGMVDAIHAQGMRVILDVVYNHVYKHESSCLELAVPYYYFGYKNKAITNGSLCGNDLDSSRKMVCKLIIDSVVDLIKKYAINGLRIDLMGLSSKYLVDNLEIESRKLDKDFVIYGEGWNMEGCLGVSECANLSNAKELPDIAFFNDYFRDNVMGHSWSSASQFGYALGDVSKCIYAMDVLHGHHSSDFIGPIQSVNYLECHDGLSYADKIVKECGFLDQGRAILGLAMLVLAQGIPFIHMGEEFLKSKKMIDNSYLNLESENDYDWNEISRKKTFIHMFKQLIKFRQEHPELFFVKEEDVVENVKISEFYRSIVYDVGNYTFIFNGNDHELVYPDINDPNIVLGNRMNITREGKLQLDAAAFVILLNDK